MTVDIDVKQTAEVALRESQDLLSEVGSFGITTRETYNAAGELGRSVKARQKEIADTKRGILAPINEAHNRVMALFKPIETNLGNAERLLKASMLDWEHAERRRREEAEAEARRKHQEEQERLAAEAEAAAAAGNEQRATVLQEMAEDVPLETPPPVERAAGTSVRQVWHGEVTDKRALLQAVLTGRASLDLIDVNMPRLNQLARELKGDFNLPGARAVAEEQMAVRP